MYAQNSSLNTDNCNNNNDNNNINNNNNNNNNNSKNGGANLDMSKFISKSLSPPGSNSIIMNQHNFNNHDPSLWLFSSNKSSTESDSKSLTFSPIALSSFSQK